MVLNIYLNKRQIDELMPDKNHEEISKIIAHEMTHTDQRAYAGIISYILLPRWIAEGYAEYIGSSSTISDEEGVRILLSGRYDENDAKHFYFKSRVMVDFLINEKGVSVENIHRKKTSEREVEDMVLEWLEDKERRAENFPSLD